MDLADGGVAEHDYRPRAPHRFRDGGPLRAVTAHRVADPSHWHLVTYGLSELDHKDSDDPAVSGWGFELTFRLAPADEEPLWAVDLLTNLAAYVWSQQVPFADGHHLDLGGPIRLGTDTALRAALLVVDPALGVLDGPFGSVELLQLVGLHADELQLCRAWSTEGVVELLSRSDPLLVTRLDRPSLLADPRLAEEARARMQADGSSLTELRVATLRVRRRAGRGAVVELGAGAASALGPALRRELIGEGATFRVVGRDAELCFAVAPSAGWTVDSGFVVVDVPVADVEGVAKLFDGRTGWGHGPLHPGLRFHVVP